MIDGIRKFYIKYGMGHDSNGLPAEETHYLAEKGFNELGVETDILHKQIKDEEGWVRLDEPHWPLDIGPHVGVAGYIQDVKNAIHIAGKPQPEAIDYPEALEPWFGRKIERTTLAKVRGVTQPTFVKPVDHKIFDGFVYHCDGKSRMNLVKFASAGYDDMPVWTSEVVSFVSEYRVFVLHGEILDVRRYRGDWGCVIDRKVVEVAVDAWVDAPAAYCLDFGLDDGFTTLVEANDGFAFGSYGLSRTHYARMLAARWSELMAQPDLPSEDPRTSWKMHVTGHEVI